MKDIILDTTWKKIQHKIYWIVNIINGVWIIPVFLANYGKNTYHNTESKKGVLNKTWQKYMWVVGRVLSIILLIGIVLGLF